jgi:hypothetical protein
MKWIVVLAVASLVLAGCAQPWPEGAPVAQEPVVAHCYITLAAVECFAVPQPGQEYRLIGARVTSPR